MQIPYKALPITPIHARLMNALYSRPVPFTLEGMEIGLGIFEPDSSPEIFSPACIEYLRVGESVWKIEIDSLDWLALHPVLEDAALYSRIPEAVRLAVLEYVWEAAVQKLAGWLDLPVEFISSQNIKFSAHKLHLVVHSNNISMRLALSYSDDNTAHYLTERLLALPARRNLLTDLPVACGLEAGKMWLDRSALAELAVGDILIPQHWDSNAPILRLPDGKAFLCQIKEEQCQVLPQENTMSQEEQTVDIDALELQLSFELERRIMTIGELSQISAGYTFALSGSPSEPVTLRVQGKAIGQGRLVDLNGQPGVQVTKLYGLADSAGKV